MHIEFLRNFKQLQMFKKKKEKNLNSEKYEYENIDEKPASSIVMSTQPLKKLQFITPICKADSAESQFCHTSSLSPAEKG